MEYIEYMAALWCFWVLGSVIAVCAAYFCGYRAGKNEGYERERETVERIKNRYVRWTTPDHDKNLRLVD